MLTVDDFSDFFKEVHGHPPFPWQRRLIREIAETRNGKWPALLDLPTGSGKTAAIDIAVFHLALEADRLGARRAPVRIAFVVDRRLVVDDAYERARKLAVALVHPAPGSVCVRVAERLRKLSGDGPPLVVRRLRGGIPREDEWARSPSQPMVLCSTVDQIGSRLLFRGYGVTDAKKPIHAGLIGSDCLILLDEAHIAEPFRQTMKWVELYRGPNWCTEDTTAPWGFSVLTATPGQKEENVFALDQEDRDNPVLKRRLECQKIPRLVGVPKSSGNRKTPAEGNEAERDSDGDKTTDARRYEMIIGEVRKALNHFEDDKHGALRPAIGIVVNRVARAREIYTRLAEECSGATESDDAPEIILMIGPARPLDRNDLAERLAPIRTRVWNDGESRSLDRPVILVATQCVEVGVDIDLDALITEAAPIDSLLQRFGRLNRAGRAITPYAAVVADESDIAKGSDDPVYGKAIKAAWDYLCEMASGKKSGGPVDFGISAMEQGEFPPEAFTQKLDAPVLLPAHLDLLGQTSPIPAADPDVALYLHGPSREPASVTVVWRADVDPGWRDQDMIRLLTLVPPRSGEAIELPLWAVQRWLRVPGQSAADVADTPSHSRKEEEFHGGRHVFVWKGNDERSRWVSPDELRPGDTIIVPASYGGADTFGWNPGCEDPVRDVADKAAEPFAAKRFVVRIAPGLLEGRISGETLSATLAGVHGQETVRQALLELDLPDAIREGLDKLVTARQKRIDVDFDIYGKNAEGEPRGVVLVAPFGISHPEAGQAGNLDEDGRPNSTEDDVAGSIFGFPVCLEDHSRDVEEKAEEFARLAGLPDLLVSDLRLAGYLHDQGKRDPRFQAWLQSGDPLGFDDSAKARILAKSGRTLPPAAREKAGLPKRWRHEAQSVRLACADAHLRKCLMGAHDPDLVLWLVGTHHGHGRPLYPHHDPAETPPAGPQSLAFDWNGLDWPSLFARLKARYGVWELARMEAILRLADHRASEEVRERYVREPYVREKQD